MFDTQEIINKLAPVLEDTHVFVERGSDATHLVNAWKGAGYRSFLMPATGGFNVYVTGRPELREEVAA